MSRDRMAFGARLSLCLFAVALVACGSGDDPTVEADAPAASSDASVDAQEFADAAPCPTLEECGWLEGYQREVVAKLAGAQPIAAGVTLAHRASQAERTAARTFLLDELTAMGLDAALDQYSASGANVVATLPGTAGASVIIVGGHFDGVPAGPAAADNATGTSIVLAAARYLTSVGGFHHPITFVLFDEEEIGLVGSEAFAERLLDDKIDVAAVHNFDMISFDGDGDRAVELWSPSPSLEQAYRDVASPLGIPIEAEPFQFSDHQSFVERGFTVVGVSEEFVNEDSTEHYHQPTDTYDKVNFDYLTMVTRLGIQVIAQAAANTED